MKKIIKEDPRCIKFSSSDRVSVLHRSCQPAVWCRVQRRELVAAAVGSALFTRTQVLVVKYDFKKIKNLEGREKYS